MTNDEFRKHWRDYALEQLDGNPTVKLADEFMLCLGPMCGGLLFDTGGPQGAPAYILKVDDQNNCYIKTDWNSPNDAAWRLFGKLVKLPDPAPQPKPSPRPPTPRKPRSKK